MSVTEEEVQAALDDNDVVRRVESRTLTHDVSVARGVYQDARSILVKGLPRHVFHGEPEYKRACELCLPEIKATLVFAYRRLHAFAATGILPPKAEGESLRFDPEARFLWAGHSLEQIRQMRNHIDLSSPEYEYERATLARILQEPVSTVDIRQLVTLIRRFPAFERVVRVITRPGFRKLGTSWKPGRGARPSPYSGSPTVTR